MNALTGAGVLTEDRLFATLDPTARALRLPGGERVMLIDTVGFLRRLPHHLIDAFHATLEQAAGADVILNVCDASSPEASEHLKVTQSILDSLGCGDRPVIPVLNKCDLAPGLGAIPMIGRAVRVSAKTREGLPRLLDAIEDNLPDYLPVKLLLPFSQARLAERVRAVGAVQNEEFAPDGCHLTARVPQSLMSAVWDYIVD